jgi:hypothetical protein
MLRELNEFLCLDLLYSMSYKLKRGLVKKATECYIIQKANNKKILDKFIVPYEKKTSMLHYVNNK